MQIGSDAHQEFFCRTFLDGHCPYEPEAFPRPALDPASLLPSWKSATQGPTRERPTP
jgi:hypothetical protein